MAHHHIIAKALLLFSFSAASLVGCGGKKDEEQSTADLCRADCERVEEECPADSQAVEFVDFCKVLCWSFIDSEECRDKYETYSDCRASQTLECEFGNTEDPDACDVEAEPFTIGTGAECVDEE